MVFGAGPAGMSAALWLKHLGFSPLIVETAMRLGGMQQLNFLRNDWLLGQIGCTGPELCAKFTEHMLAECIAVETGCSPVAIEAEERLFTVTLRRRNSVTLLARCGAIVLATGLYYRASEVLAGVPGFDTLTAEDIAYGPYAFLDIDKLSGKKVLIVGCGDNAFENAHLLLKAGAEVVLACRSLPRAQTRLREMVHVFAAGWALATHTRIVGFYRGDTDIEVTLATDMGTQTYRVHKIHVLAGYAPNTGFLKETLDSAFYERLRFDTEGYLIVDDWGRTGSPGIYAAGDLCNPTFPNVASAIASGAKTAKAIEIDFRSRS